MPFGQIDIASTYEESKTTIKSDSNRSINPLLIKDIMTRILTVTQIANKNPEIINYNIYFSSKKKFSSPLFRYGSRS